jgi:hypothetical protein
LQITILIIVLAKTANQITILEIAKKPRSCDSISALRVYGRMTANEVVDITPPSLCDTAYKLIKGSNKNYHLLGAASV